MVLHSTINLNVFFYLKLAIFPCEKTIEEFTLHRFNKWKMLSWVIDGNNISRDVFINIFSLYQKLFFAVLKLQQRFKQRKYVRFDAFDMQLNFIDNIHDSTVIQLIENNTIYYFRDRDIFNICFNSLTNGYFLFPSPNVPKNPWTNREFSKHNLYNILLYLKSRNKINSLLCSYLECNLDIYLFSCKQFHELQKILIYQMVEKMEIDDTSNIIIEMFTTFIKDYEILYSKITSEFIRKNQDKIRFMIKKYYIFLYTSYESALYNYNKECFFNECYAFILNYNDKFVKLQNSPTDISGNDISQLHTIYENV